MNILEHLKIIDSENQVLLIYPEKEQSLSSIFGNYVDDNFLDITNYYFSQAQILNFQLGASINNSTFDFNKYYLNGDININAKSLTFNSIIFGKNYMNETIKIVNGKNNCSLTFSDGFITDIILDNQDKTLCSNALIGTTASNMSLINSGIKIKIPDYNNMYINKFILQ
jgi:hypothetical protein